MPEARRVLVLHGGLSAEREVSLVSGRSCGEALARLGWEVELLDWRGDLTDLVARLARAPDLVFNALHGRGGEDGAMQGVLTLAGVRCTHSSVLSSAVAMDKPLSRLLFEQAGLAVPPGGVVSAAACRDGDPRARPFVVKPLAEGSSVGVQIVRGGDAPPQVRPEDEWVLVEAYIPGRELTVSVLGDEVLGVTELRPSKDFYDYEAKYSEGITDHLVPAPIPEAVAEAVRAGALLAHRVLGCSCVSRSDFRWDEEGVLTPAGQGVRGAVPGLYLLEVNTQPGMTPASLVPEQAAAIGMSFDALVERIAEDSRCF